MVYGVVMVLSCTKQGTSSPSDSFIPYGCQTIEEDDIDAVSSVMRDPYLTCGPKITDFENALAKKTGAPFMVAVSSGTTALHLAAQILDITPGDQVLVPSMTFLATANVVRYLGGEVIFTDVDPKTGLMNWASYQEALARAHPEKVKAIFYVHMNGQVGDDFVHIANDAKAKGYKVLEDAAHAIGSSYVYNDQTHVVGACAHSDAVTFSFHPVKTMTTGEGGAIAVKDLSQFERMKRLRHHGMQFTPSDEKPWGYEMPELGYNYRMTDIQAALGISQLNKLDRFVNIRRELVATYDEAFKTVEFINPIKKCFPNITAWHLYPILIDFTKLSMSKGELVSRLKAKGIGTQVHYIPVHTQPYYQKRAQPHLPGVEMYYKAVLSLPLYPLLSQEGQRYIINSIIQL